MSSNELSSIILNRLGSEVALPERTDLPGQQSDVVGSEPSNRIPVETEKEEEIPKEDVDEVAKFLNESSDLFNLSLQFKVENNINRIVVSVVDKDTEEVVRQIPAQEIVELAERLNEMVGVLFNETA